MIEKTISHYKILEKLGEGGMGVVYKAKDMKLDRFVALKFLPSHLIDDEKALNRLLKEAKAASKINHPNVCTIYAIEEYEDTHFIVMEYVDGQTLRQKTVGANGQSPFLSVDDAVDYSVQICKALKAAHDKDIIHRDIKSENIMINLENIVKVMDFGLAKLKDEAGLTKTKTAGTIAYMSPEQIKGEDIDHRVDIWAFGVVLFEMLTGEFPFEGQYESAMSYSIVNTNPKSITDMWNDVPFNIEQLIYKALEKDKNRRYQNANELIEDLKNVPSVVTTSEKQEKSIIVLPFVNMSPDPEQEYFSDGLTEEIITDLSHIHDLLVISRSSAMTFKGTKKKIKEIAKEVNVQYVLEGSVRKAGNNLRITAQLIDATTDAHLWAEKYTGTLDDVFDIQEKVSRSIVDALKLKLSLYESEKIAERPIDNVQAYECYLKARQEIWRFTEEGLERALLLLQNGLEIVGENELLYAAISLVYWQYINAGIKPDVKYLEEIEKYTRMIFILNPDFSQGYFLRGVIHYLRGNLNEAVVDSKQALAIDPNNPDALLQITRIYISAGKTSAARPLVKKLLEIDPLTPINRCMLGYISFSEGRFEDAIEPYRMMYKLDPENPIGRWFYASILTWSHRHEEAFKIIDILVNDTPQTIFAQLGLFWRYAMQGKKNEALKVVTSEMTIAARWGEYLSRDMAHGYAILGEKEEALNWLENAVNLGFINYPFLNEYDPFLENIRGEKRFKNLMERVKYEWENFEV